MSNSSVFLEAGQNTDGHWLSKHLWLPSLPSGELRVSREEFCHTGLSWLFKGPLSIVCRAACLRSIMEWSPLLSSAKVLCYPVAWAKNRLSCSTEYPPGHQSPAFCTSFQRALASEKGSPPACFNILVPHQRSRVMDKIGWPHLPSCLQWVGCTAMSS